MVSSDARAAKIPAADREAEDRKISSTHPRNENKAQKNSSYEQLLEDFLKSTGIRIRQDDNLAGTFPTNFITGDVVEEGNSWRGDEHLTEKPADDFLEVANLLQDLKLVDEKKKNNAQDGLEQGLQQSREQQEGKVVTTCNERLKRASAAHSEHLEHVVRQPVKIERNQKVEKAPGGVQQLYDLLICRCPLTSVIKKELLYGGNVDAETIAYLIDALKNGRQPDASDAASTKKPSNSVEKPPFPSLNVSSPTPSLSRPAEPPSAEELFATEKMLQLKAEGRDPDAYFFEHEAPTLFRQLPQAAVARYQFWEMYEQFVVHDQRVIEFARATRSIAPKRTAFSFFVEEHYAAYEARHPNADAAAVAAHLHDAFVYLDTSNKKYEKMAADDEARYEYEIEIARLPEWYSRK